MDQKPISGLPVQTLRDTIKQFADHYGKAYAKCAIIKDGEPYLYLADITIQHKNDIPIEEKVQEYDNVILAVVPLALSELETLVEEMQSGQIRLGSLGTINARNAIQDHLDRVPSRTHYNGYYHDWPCRCTRASLTRQDPLHGMNDPVVKAGLPAYPHVLEACNAFFRHKTPTTQYEPICINFLIPDYRAKINELKIDGKEISVLVESKESAMDDLLVQISCKKRGMGYRHSGDMNSSNGILKFRAEFVPDEVIVYLLDSEDGKIIDSKDFSQYRPIMADGVTVATSAESLGTMISNGEDQHTEFKQDLDRNNTEFLESVVSFANTGGGKILLGVSDGGRVVGSFEDPDRLDKKITNLVHSHCEPDITIRVERVALEERAITIVHVEEGKDTPYLLIGKSAYKRVGKDDRAFSRRDFDTIVNKRFTVSGTRYRLRMPMEDEI